MTLSGLHQRFLLHCEVEKRLSLETVKAYKSDFVQLLEFLRERGRWGLASQDNLQAFTTANIREYQYHMAALRWSTATIRRRLVELNRFGAWLVERSYLKATPMVGVAIPKKVRPLPRVVDWPVSERAVAGERHPRNQAILALLAYAGLRRGEVVAANVGDYSRESVSLRVRGKGNKERVIPLPGAAVAALEAYLRTRPGLGLEEPLFVTRRGRISKKVVVKAVARAGKRLGVKLHPHLFRHTFATELLNRKADLRAIQKLLGHESLATTEVYMHVSPGRQREVIQLLDRPARREEGYGTWGY